MTTNNPNLPSFIPADVAERAARVATEMNMYAEQGIKAAEIHFRTANIAATSFDLAALARNIPAVEALIAPAQSQENGIIQNIANTVRRGFSRS